MDRWLVTGERVLRIVKQADGQVRVRVMLPSQLPVWVVMSRNELLAKLITGSQPLSAQ